MVLGSDVGRGFSAPSNCQQSAGLTRRLACVQCGNIGIVSYSIGETAMEAAVKEDRLGIRLAPGEKALFKRAAELERKSLSEFVLASARGKEESVRAGQRRVT